MIFNLFSIARGNELVVHVDRSNLLFILQGEITVSGFGGVFHAINKDQMILVPLASEVLIQSYAETQILMMPFDLENFFSAEYINRLLSVHTVGEIGYLRVKERIFTFLMSISDYMSDGAKIEELYETLKKELFILLQYYYSVDEVASLFGLIIGKDMAFKQLVMKNCLLVSSLDELAALTQYSKSGFIQKFQRCFGESPHHWILQYKAKRILQDLLYTTKQFQEIADLYMFASYSYFYTFCKKYYSLSPNEIRKKGKEGISLSINEEKCNILKVYSLFL